MEPALIAETDAAVEQLLPRFGRPMARRVVETRTGAVSLLEAGDGPVAVLLHGGFGGAGNWYRTLGPLALRYRVVAPDCPGYGLSAPNPPNSLAWLDDLLMALDVARVALVGHARGGALALAYARARPGAIAALVLSDVPLAPATLLTPGTVVPGHPPGLGRLGGRSRRVEAWYPGVAARFEDRRLLAPEYLYYLWCLARLRPEQDQRPPGALTPGPDAIPGPGERTWPAVPTLLIWGRGNRWTRVSVARQLQERIPDATLRIIDHSKGIPNLEQPGEFNHAVMTFLAAHSESR